MSGIGHLAPALMAKTAAPAVPLWTLLAASEANDILYFALTSTGIEKKVEISIDFQRGVQYLAVSANPWSHGLFMSLIWSAIATGVAFAWRRNRQAAGIIGLVVFSHWALDFLMHANLPLFIDGSPLVGLGLERTGAGLVFMTVLDLVLLSSGFAIYWINRKRAARGGQRS